MTEHLLDARGLTCPLPILRARKQLKLLEAGQRLTVLATDPSARRDFPSFCAQTGQRLLEEGCDADGVLRFVIEKVD